MNQSESGWEVGAKMVGSPDSGTGSGDSEGVPAGAPRWEKLRQALAETEARLGVKAKQAQMSLRAEPTRMESSRVRSTRIEAVSVAEVRNRPQFTVTPTMTGIPNQLTEVGSVVWTQGSRSLGMAMAARACMDQGWCAVVGVPDFGWSAAQHLGLDLARMVAVQQIDLQIDSILATLVEGYEVVFTGVRLPVGVQRRLAACARMYRTLIITEVEWDVPHQRVEASSRSMMSSTAPLAGVHVDFSWHHQRYNLEIGGDGVQSSPVSSPDLQGAHG